MPLNGTLKDLSLPDLVQLKCREERRTQVRLKHRGQEGMLVFVDGQLIHASMGAVTGDEAVYELLAWEDGDFQVVDDPAVPPRNVNTSWGALLLEGLRRFDETRTERNTIAEATLQKSKGQAGLRSALIVSGTGVLRANATDGQATEDAALIAFIAGCAEAIGTVLDAGPFEQGLCNLPDEKVLFKKIMDDYVGCWLENRAVIRSLQTLLQSLETDLF